MSEKASEAAGHDGVGVRRVSGGVTKFIVYILGKTSLLKPPSDEHSRLQAILSMLVHCHLWYELCRRGGGCD